MHRLPTAFIVELMNPADQRCTHRAAVYVRSVESGCEEKADFLARNAMARHCASKGGATDLTLLRSRISSTEVNDGVEEWTADFHDGPDAVWLLAVPPAGDTIS